MSDSYSESTAPDEGTSSVAPESAPVNDAPAPENAEFNPESHREELGKIYDKAMQPRADDGKFKNPLAEALDPAAEPNETTDQPKDEGAEQQPAAIGTPQSWSAEMKAKWAALPPDVQAYVAERDTNAHKQISQMGQALSQYEQIKEPLEQLRAKTSAYGVDPGTGLKNLLSAQEQLENPATRGSAIKWLAESYGVNLAELAGSAPAQSDGTWSDPEVIRLQSELQAVRSELNQWSQKTRQFEEERTRTEIETARKEIDTFAKDKPHFEALRQEMAMLFRANPNLTIAEAYDRAQYANPDVRKIVLAEQMKAEEEKRKDEQLKRVAAAKDVTAINQKSGKGVAGVASENMRDTLGAIYDRIAGG